MKSRISFLFISCGKKETISLNAPSISLNQNTVSWDSIDKAQGYIVYVGDQNYETTNISYSLIDLEPGNYEVSVKAFCTIDDKRIYSEISNKVTYSFADISTEFDSGEVKLPTQEIVKDEDIIAWDIIHFATGYRVFFDGKAKCEVKTNFYKMDASKAGKYKVPIKAFSSYEKYGMSDSSNEIEMEVTKVYKPVTVNVSDAPYNAVGDGKTCDRENIQKAIDDVYKLGGGVVVLSSNRTYLSGNIFLRDNVTLKFEDVAMLKQSTNKGDYTKINEDGTIVKNEVYFGTNLNEIVQFNHNWFYNYPLISCKMGTKNITVVGNGTIKMRGYDSEDTVIRTIGVGFCSCKYFKMSDFTVTNYNAYAL